METFTALTPSELPILHPSLPRDPTDRNMAASTGDIDPYVKKKSSERLLDLLEITRQAWLPRIVGSQRPADRATLYLRFDQDDELVQEIEKISNKKSHHCWLGVFFRGDFTVGEVYDTVILPLEKVGNAQARQITGRSGKALDWGRQEYFVVTRKFLLSVDDGNMDGGKLAGVVVAFDRN